MVILAMARAPNFNYYHYHMLLLNISYSPVPNLAQKLDAVNPFDLRR